MIARVLVCDATTRDKTGPVAPAGALLLVEVPWPATSRASRDDEVLRLVASRDGWLVLADGSHRCPFHAGATT